jgi:hypothetical protein
MNPNPTLIDAIECAGAALEQSERYYQQKEAQDARARALIQPAVDACLKAGLVGEKETVKLAATLADPALALEWLTKVAEYVGQPAARIGEPTTGNGNGNGHPGKSAATKKASASPFAGRRSSRLGPADVRLFENLGLPVPNDE